MSACNPRTKLEPAFMCSKSANIQDGYDVVLMDSWAEVTSMVKDQMGWARNKVESWLLELLEKNNKANNKANKNTAFICIQQMTKVKKN